MDLNILSGLLQQLIKENNQVIIPGFGSFKIEETPSFLLEDGKTITPPYKNIVFKNSELGNDGKLEEAYSQLMGIDADLGRDHIRKTVLELKKMLMSKSEIEIPGFGILSFGDGYVFSFKTNKNFNVINENYGLETLIMKRENDALIFDDTEREIEPYKIDASNTIQADNEKYNVEKEVTYNENINIDDEYETDEIVLDEEDDVFTETSDNADREDLQESKVEEQRKEEEQQQEQQESVQNIESRQEQFDKDNSEIYEEILVSGIASDINGEEKVTEENAEKEKVTEVKAAEEKGDELNMLLPEEKEGVDDRKVSDEEIKSRNGIWIVIGILIVLIVLAVLVYVFQDPLRPLLEKLFYSDEELNFLNKIHYW